MDMHNCTSKEEKPKLYETLQRDFSPASDLRILLERTGFRIRGHRADCAYCQGTSRLTVRIGPGQVFYCHRCKRAGNAHTLSRALKIPIAPETLEARERRARERFFEKWRSTCQSYLLEELYALTLKAESAKEALAFLALDSKHDALAESEWDALANLHHREADILAALDTLCFEKLSPWLESPMTRAILFRAFEAAVSR